MYQPTAYLYTPTPRDSLFENYTCEKRHRKWLLKFGLRTHCTYQWKQKLGKEQRVNMNKSVSILDLFRFLWLEHSLYQALTRQSLPGYRGCLFTYRHLQCQLIQTTIYQLMDWTFVLNCYITLWMKTPGVVRKIKFKWSICTFCFFQIVLV